MRCVRTVLMAMTGKVRIPRVFRVRNNGASEFY